MFTHHFPNRAHKHTHTLSTPHLPLIWYQFIHTRCHESERPCSNTTIPSLMITHTKSFISLFASSTPKSSILHFPNPNRRIYHNRMPNSRVQLCGHSRFTLIMIIILLTPHFFPPTISPHTHTTTNHDSCTNIYRWPSHHLHASMCSHQFVALLNLSSSPLFHVDVEAECRGSIQRSLMPTSEGERERIDESVRNLLQILQRYHTFH